MNEGLKMHIPSGKEKSRFKDCIDNEKTSNETAPHTTSLCAVGIQNGKIRIKTEFLNEIEESAIMFELEKIIESRKSRASDEKNSSGIWNSSFGHLNSTFSMNS